MGRVFEDTPAVRGRVPIMLGMVGPSSSGKTYSSLRVATGIQKVTGGDIYVIDTEANRAKHYADMFNFRHVPFAAPFNSLDYLAAIEHCYNKGAKIIIVDSTSHEHEGQGGHLESHEMELKRLSQGDAAKAERVNFLAWVKPKMDRRKLINSILQMNANFIFCFRAKEKIKLTTGKPPKELGWQPIGGEEWIYEMTINFMLPPNSKGTPAWSSEHTAEQAIMKLPKQFEYLFTEPKSLDEGIGEALAKWAQGDSKPQQKPAGDLGEKALMLNLIKEFMLSKWPTKSESDKLSKQRAIEVFFNCVTWKQVESLDEKKLKQGFKELTDQLGGDEKPAA
jgi:ABC-type dipeptide/oligopeptide/nickel transport system ATPase subunit